MAYTSTEEVVVLLVVVIVEFGVVEGPDVMLALWLVSVFVVVVMEWVLGVGEWDAGLDEAFSAELELDLEDVGV